MTLKIYAEAARESLLDDLFKMLGRDPTDEESEIYCTEHRLERRAQWIEENTYDEAEYRLEDER